MSDNPDKQSSWFITGASSGFGRLLTEQLLERGHRVAATARRPDALDDLRDSAGDRLWVGRLDVTDADAARATVDAAFEALDTIEVVVNNAGFGTFGSVEEVSDEQIRQAIDTNLLGSIHVIRSALPHLRAQGGGRIMQVSSAGGQTTYPSFGAYHAAKWGIEGFCETMAKEVGALGIDVTIVEPGATPTGFGGALDLAPAMEAYSRTPAAEVRRMITTEEFPLLNDPGKIAAAMIDSAAVSPAPLRLPLGRDTYEDVRASYVGRLEEHDAHRDVALSVLRDDALTS